MASQTNILPRSYRKLFRPNGIVLGDAREYIPGDDVRFINWNITAKTGIPFVDSVKSDSGYDIIFALDISASMKFGTQRQSKFSLASNILGSLSRLAEMHGDRAGLVLFSGGVEKFLKPRRNVKIFKYAIEKSVSTGKKSQTNLASTLKILSRILRNRSVIILICDVFCLATNRKATLAQLHTLREKHDVILLAVIDDGEMPHARAGKVLLEDLETGETLWINTDDMALMSKIMDKYASYQKLIFEDIRSLGVKISQANTRDSLEKSIFTFLNNLL
ncbi:MAG: DUF58 domain-containing protein [Puniceicoccales bacterium]|jgi:uncharacterized protein (DUF58 family)|nr:DUF58 domain-containing protein [Puniceicoccales bacterium]